MDVDTPRIWCDSSAALQASRRMGVGKMRHIAVSHLFIQELVKTKQVIIGKVKGEKNPSDVMTKHLPTGEAMKRAIEMLGMIDPYTRRLGQTRDKAQNEGNRSTQR